jgi:hypothetical protein
MPGNDVKEKETTLFTGRREAALGSADTGGGLRPRAADIGVPRSAWVRAGALAWRGGCGLDES